ncbi:MAG: septum formation inhibitor Maf [Ahniella sp.]|nr:septum formation inhibitor Maf [Ahniella sp.]
MANESRTLFLASQSPRRQELLRQLGLSFEVLDATIEERQLPGESALDYVRRVARDKAAAGWMQVAHIPGAVVLGSDTEVVLDGVVFGKPVDREDASRMLVLLSGRTHEVHTAVAVKSAGRSSDVLHTSKVRIADWPEAAMSSYLDSGESMGKAGAYAIQGRAAAWIPSLDGSHSGVMGLPLFETAQLLREYGLDC